MSWLSYANYGAVTDGNEHLTGYGTSVLSRPVQGQTYRQIREHITGSWRIRGLDEATVRILVNTFGASFQQNSAFPDVGAFLIATGSPVATDSTIDVSNFRPSADAQYSILTGWRFQIFGDPTVYTITADAVLPTVPVSETDAQIKAPPAGVVYGVDYDETNDIIVYGDYVAGDTTARIHKVDSDGTNDSLLATTTVNVPLHYVAADPANSHCYYAVKATADTFATIRRVGYDGSGDTLIYTSVYSSPSGIDIDLDNGYLYIWNTAVGVTRTTLAGASATTMYTGAVYGVGVKPGAALYIQANSSKIVYSISEGLTSTVVATLAIAINNIMHDTSDGGFFGVLVSGNDLHKYNATGEELYERTDFFFGTKPEAVVITTALNKFIYTHGTGGVRSINLFTTAVTLSIEPNLSANAAVANGAEIYFFLTENCQAQRDGEAAGPYSLILRTKYDTRWLNGPSTEEVV